MWRYSVVPAVKPRARKRRLLRGLALAGVTVTRRRARTTVVWPMLAGLAVSVAVKTEFWVRPATRLKGRRRPAMVPVAVEVSAPLNWRPSAATVTGAPGVKPVPPRVIGSPSPKQGLPGASVAALAVAGTAQTAVAKRAGTAIRRIFMVVAPRLVVTGQFPRRARFLRRGNPGRVASVRKN